METIKAEELIQELGLDMLTDEQLAQVTGGRHGAYHDGRNNGHNGGHHAGHKGGHNGAHNGNHKHAGKNIPGGVTGGVVTGVVTERNDGSVFNFCSEETVREDVLLTSKDVLRSLTAC